MENRHSMQIAINRVVAIRYTMKNSDGEVLEDIMNGDPVNYLHGSAGILQLLQGQLEGLKQGNKKTVKLLATSGLTTEDFTFEVIVDAVRDASNEELLLGYPVTLTVEKCEEGCVCYNEHFTL